VRRPLLIVLLCLLATQLASCSATDLDDEDRETRRPLKVVHALGETRVPGRAERVVSLTPVALDNALALGVRPVGAATPPGGRLPSYLGPGTRELTLVGPGSRLDLRTIDALDPDLIIGSKTRHGERYEQLREIASTVMTEDGAGGDWKLDARLHGEALGRTDQTERLLSANDRRVARLRQTLGARAGRTEVSVVRVLPGEIRVAGRESFAGAVLADLGLARPPAQERPEPTVKVSRAEIPSVDADLLLLSRARGAGKRLERLLRSPDWTRLRAVRRRRVRRVPDDLWWSGGGLVAAGVATRDLRRLLAR
jgi:iron complex transport system substrate-binding protein